MDAKTCLKKLEYVGVLAFATVDKDGAPQIRNISSIPRLHYRNCFAMSPAAIVKKCGDCETGLPKI